MAESIINEIRASMLSSLQLPGWSAKQNQHNPADPSSGNIIMTEYYNNQDPSPNKQGSRAPSTTYNNKRKRTPASDQPKFDVQRMKELFNTIESPASNYISTNPLVRQQELEQRVLELETELALQKTSQALNQASINSTANAREMDHMRLEYQNKEFKEFVERTVKREINDYVHTVRMGTDNVILVARELAKFSEPATEKLLDQMKIILSGAMKGVEDAKVRIEVENRGSVLRRHTDGKKRVVRKKKTTGRVV